MTFATQVVALDSQDLREAAPPASSMSSMLSAALARRPLTVETWLHQVEFTIGSSSQFWVEDCYAATPAIKSQPM